MVYTVIRSNVVFGILIFLFATILIFLFLVEPEVRQEILPEYVVSYEKAIFDVSPGTLEGGSVYEGVRTISLNDVSVDNMLQTTELDVARDASFSSSVFSSDVYDFGFSVDLDKVKSAGVKFTVYDLEGDGELKVYINGKTALSRAVGIGDQVQAYFPESYLKDGANRVEIATESSGFMFWQKNSFTLLDLVLFTEEYDTGKSTASQVFSLSESEASNADDATLKAYLVPWRTANVQLKLNGQSLLTATPPQNLELDIPTTALQSGANVLEWSVERDGKYDIRFANFIVDTTETSGRATTYIFKVNEAVWLKIQSGNYDCTLKLLRDSGDTSIDVELNSNFDEYDFVSDELEVDVCDLLVDGENKVKFLAEDELRLDRATLTIKNKEE